MSPDKSGYFSSQESFFYEPREVLLLHPAEIILNDHNDLGDLERVWHKL